MPSDRKIPVMPMATHDIAVDAWHRSVRTERSVQLVADEILEIRTGMLNLSGEIAGFALEAQRDRLTAQDDRVDLRRQMRALTESMRHVRKNTSADSDEQIRNELPTLPEIIIEVNRQAVAAAQVEITRHSDAKKLKRQVWWEKMFRDGAGAAIKHIVSLILVGIFAWMAHDIFHVTHEKRTEPLPAQSDHAR